MPVAFGVGDRAGPVAPVEVADAVEHGQPAGGEQQRVGDGDVLVVAVAEADIEGFEVVAPYDLVPGGHDRLEEVGPVVQGAGEPLRVAGEDLVPHVGLDAAVRVGAGEVAQQHVGVAGVREALVDGVDGALGQPVVAVDEPHVGAGGLGQPDVACPAEADVVRQVHDAHAQVAGGVVVEDRTAAVGGAVVDGDDLDGCPGAGQDRVEAAGQVALDSVGRHDEADPYGSGLRAAVGRHIGLRS